jgi:hypothetical protein
MRGFAFLPLHKFIISDDIFTLRKITYALFRILMLLGNLRNAMGVSTIENTVSWMLGY